MKPQVKPYESHTCSGRIEGVPGTAATAPALVNPATNGADMADDSQQSHHPDFWLVWETDDDTIVGICQTRSEAEDAAGARHLTVGPGYWGDPSDLCHVCGGEGFTTEGERCPRCAWIEGGCREPGEDDRRCPAGGTRINKPNNRTHYMDCPTCGRRVGLIGMGRSLLSHHYRPQALR